MLKGLTWLLALQFAGNLLSTWWQPMLPVGAALCSLVRGRQTSSADPRVAEPAGA